MMIRAIHHVGLTVMDLERAASFFREICGFTARSGLAAGAHHAMAPPGAAAERALTLLTPNCRIELCEGAAPGDLHERQVNEAGITHISIQAHDIDTLYERLPHVGARAHAPPLALGTGYTYVYARDAEANVIEFEGVPYAPAMQAPWVAHVAIATPNIARLASFYHKVVGGERRDGAKIGPNPAIDRLAGLTGVEALPTWVVGQNVSLELWQYLHPPTATLAESRAFDELGYSHLCFEVTSATETLREFQRAGAHVVMPPVQRDEVTTAIVRDPDGNLLELAEFVAGAPDTRRAVAAFDIIKRMDMRREGQEGAS